MTASPQRPKKKEVVPSPGDDVVKVPRAVREEPPYDRFCDLVLTGGVASGVVYPWAVVEIARAYRFRNIGGTSVGAMAAALAAAAEYGRRTGYEEPFEALRRSPASLARVLPDGRTRMMSLFQTNERGRRLIRLWCRLFCGHPGQTSDEARHDPPRIGSVALWPLLLEVFREPLLLGALAGAGVARLVVWPLDCWPWPLILLMAVTAFVGAIVGFGVAVTLDIRLGLIRNFYGLCKGGTTENLGSPDGPTGLSDWLHEGIQRSAGLKEGAGPLTFRNLWHAPMQPGAPSNPCGPDDPASRRSINLQMITTNATHGRPYHLPMLDRTSRLFFRRDELKGYFPGDVLDALVASSQPYRPLHRDVDPPAGAVDPAFRELPGADLPIVVAARLSLSFPLLFSAVPLWAIDYEAPFALRKLRRCVFTDGGASANFPIHLFDASIPRWPTFGLWLDTRTPYLRPDAQGGEERVWLPEYNGKGWGDSWDRFDPLSQPEPAPGVVRQKTSAGRELSFVNLVNFLAGVGSSATCWHDRTAIRLPHVRNRIARLLLLPNEGGLHIGMRREQILQMADDYGTRAGRLFVERFRDENGQPSRAWREQRWIRFNVLVNGLRERLDGFATGAAWAADAVPLREAIQRAIQGTPDHEPVESRNHHDYKIAPREAAGLQALLAELALMEARMKAVDPAFVSEPEPELRLRAPL